MKQQHAAKGVELWLLLNVQPQTKVDSKLLDPLILSRDEGGGVSSPR